MNLMRDRRIALTIFFNQLYLLRFHAEIQSKEGEKESWEDDRCRIPRVSRDDS